MNREESEVEINDLIDYAMSGTTWDGRFHIDSADELKALLKEVGLKIIKEKVND